jgi:hypothetical protein
MAEGSGLPTLAVNASPWAEGCERQDLLDHGLSRRSEWFARDLPWPRRRRWITLALADRLVEKVALA